MKSIFWAGSAAVAAGTLLSVGCFGSSSSKGGTDASFGGDDGVGEASVPDTGRDATTSTDGGGTDGGGSQPEAGCDVKSTCESVEIKFIGWIQGTDGGPQNVEMAVDDGTPDGGPNGTVVLATSVSDAGLPSTNLLVGDFVTTADGGIAPGPLYANDNNACDVPDFGGRANAYYLLSMQGLPVSTSWQTTCGCGGGCGGAGPCNDAGTGGLCDYESNFYSQTCPNFGGNCVVTPARIEQIDVIATSSDSTCKVCVYDSTTPSASSVIKCLSPGASIDRSAFVGADGGITYPALVRLDDGTSCASY
jgi:hypothetical protein